MSLKDKSALNKGDNSKQKSRKGRITLILLISSIALLFIYFIVYWHANNTIVNVSSKNLLQANQNTSDSLSKDIKSDYVVLNSLAKDFEKDSIQSESNIKNALNSFIQESNSSYKNVYYLDSNGYIYTNNNKSKNQDTFLSNLLALENTAKYVSNNNSIYSVIPVKLGSKKAGLLIGYYSSDKIVSKHLKGLYGDDSISYLINSNGDMLVAGKSKIKNVKFTNFFTLSDKSPSNKDVSDKMRNKLAKKSKSTDIFFINDEPFIVAYSHIDGINDWYQVTFVQRSVALSNINCLVFVSILIGAFVIFCLGIIGYSYIKSNVAHSENLHDLAFNDPLTGYPNFLRFKLDAEKLIKNNKDVQYVLCYADLVGFKFINEAFGYEVGDQVLKDISKIFQDHMREGEIFARVSGDRFIVLRKKDESETRSPDDILYTLVDRISKISPLISSRMRLEVHVGAYAIETDSDLKINAMFDRAIIALETINRSDTCLAMYDEVLRTDQLEKKNIEQRMESALNNGEFQVYIQPKYKTSNKTLAAGEALIRWIDPDKGVVPPIQFIPIFEKNRFIFNLDRYVLEVVCRFIRERLDNGKDVVPISLNVSPVEILMPHFTQSYISIKDKYNIPDKIIELEFTEGVFFENEELFKSVIIELKDAGFCCSLDDFGSGFSSLNVLKEMPVDILKLDRLFFHESGDIVRDRSIIRSVVAMARSLNIKTVAEGVETLETVEFLKLIGCNMIQGYIYARPMPLRDFIKLMDSEQLNENGDFSDDYDKVSEIIPVDKPYDAPIRNTYEVIFEVNLTSDTYHMYKKEECIFDLENIDEIGEYSNLYNEKINSKIHPDYITETSNTLSVKNLENYFKDKRELRVEYKRLDTNGKYRWARARILKAKNDGGQTVIFIYIKQIEDAKKQDNMLNVANTRLSSAFIGIARMIFELDLNTGNLEVVKSFSTNMEKAISGNKYEPLIQYLSSYLLHPKFVDKFNQDCSIKSIREQFTNSANKTICYEYFARSSKESDHYKWYSARFSYNPNLSDKVLIAIQDITTAKQNQEYLCIRQSLMEKAVKHYYDEILEINLDKDKYTLTSIVNRDEKKQSISEGSYKDFYNTEVKGKVLSSDYELIKEVLSAKGLWDMYNDENVTDFTLNIKKKDYKGDFRWYSLYIIPNRKSVESNDAIVFIYFKNIQFEKDLHDKVTLNTNRLTCTTNLFELTFETDFRDEKATIFGGKNIPANLALDREMKYSQLCDTIKNTYVSEEDFNYFERSMDIKNLTNDLKNNNQTSFFVRSKIEGTKWILIKFLFDNRSKTATVFISDKEDGQQ